MISNLNKIQSLIKQYQSAQREVKEVEREIEHFDGTATYQEQLENVEIYRATSIWGSNMEISTIQSCINDITLSQEKGVLSGNIQITSAQLPSVDIGSLTIHFETYEEPIPWEDNTITVTDIIFKGDVDFTAEQKEEVLFEMKTKKEELFEKLNLLEEQLIVEGVDVL